MSEPQPPAPARRRTVLGISGWMLFVCLFLPTLRVCGDPMAPIQFPPTYGLYLGAIAVAVIGLSTVRRRRQAMFVVLLALWLTSIFAYLALWIGAAISTPAGFTLGLVFIVLLILILRRAAPVRWGETAVALGCLIHGLLALAWSALLAFDPDGMWGATVSLLASSLMVVASGAYLVGEAEAARRRAHTPIDLPEARIL